MHEHPASFRDPDGGVVWIDGILHRRVAPSFQEDFDAYRAQLHDDLAAAGHVVDFKDVGPGLVQPQVIPFVSYPYEWSPGQLRDAALLTLDLAERAYESGLELKDASAYNVTFRSDGSPVFLDHTSFERRRHQGPWPAYGQFCRHFLAPLALASHDVRLMALTRVHLDGVPLGLAAKLLPRRLRLRPGLQMHIVQHARSQARHPGGDPGKQRAVGKNQYLGLLDSLRSAVKRLTWKPAGTWTDYDGDNTYTDQATERKEQIIRAWAKDAQSVWDLGANTGRYARAAAAVGRGPVIAFDLDPGAIERLHGQGGLHGVVMDLTNPSPGQGWGHTERDSLAARGPCHTAMALALVHHLAIGNNVPLTKVAAWMATFCDHAIVEWVPKTDPQVERMLASRRDVFADYTQEGFVTAFEQHFEVVAAEPVPDCERVLYHFRLRR